MDPDLGNSDSGSLGYDSGSGSGSGSTKKYNCNTSSCTSTSKAGLAFAASSSLSHHTWAVLGDWLIRPSPPGPQQPHSQQHQNSVSNRVIEITFGFCSVRFLPLNWVILQKEKTSYNLILIRMVTSGSGIPRRL